MDFEAQVRKAYEAILRPGDLAVDIGAHLGDHALPMTRRVMPGGKVHAFEPLPMCRKQLQQKLDAEPALKAAIQLYDLALGAAEASTEFVVARDALAYSGLHQRVYDVPTRVERIPIQVRRLDDVLAGLPALRYIKIDAEGGELDALRGGAGLIDKHRPVVGFEFGANSIGEYGITCADMGAFWLGRNYLLFDVIARPLATLDDFVASSTRQAIWDYIAIPAEKTHLTQIILQAVGR